jgi:hypothetical protein
MDGSVGTWSCQLSKISGSTRVRSLCNNHRISFVSIARTQNKTGSDSSVTQCLDNVITESGLNLAR